MHATKNTVEPYLFFEGRCDEAFEFYRKALNAEVTGLMRYKESPEPSGCAPGSQDKVMHANLRIGGTTIMASDGRCSGKPNFQGFALTLNVPTEEEAERRFAALADGGQVHMPLAKTFFAAKFGMVADRFGVLWMVIMMSQNAGTDQGLRIEHTIGVKAPARIVWKMLLEEISTKMVGADGKSMHMKLEAWPGGRLYRDLGSNSGHLWGHVQVIKPPALLEITGPMFMSYAANNHVQYRLTEDSPGRTRLKLVHSAVGGIAPEHRAGCAEAWMGILENIRKAAEESRGD